MLKYRLFGRSGLSVSKIVFGGGRVGGIVIFAEDNVRRDAIRIAKEGGINWVDTAASYGDGKSEEALGWLLPEAGHKPYVSTKFSVDPGLGEDIPSQIERSLGESLTRLRRTNVNLLQLHNRIELVADGRGITVDHILGKNGVADGLDRLRAKGVTGLQGITALGDAACCKEVIASGRFDSAQVYHNLLNPSAARAMPPAWTGQNFDGLMKTCHDNGVAVLNIRVFAASIIAAEERTGRESILTKDTDIESEERKARAVFATLGDEHGTRAQIALRFALSNSMVSCVVIGVAETFHVEEAIAAVDMGALPQSALNALETLYETDFGRA